VNLFSIYRLFHLTKYNLNNIFFIIHPLQRLLPICTMEIQIRMTSLQDFENKHDTKQCSQCTSSKHKIEEKWSKLNCCLCHHFLIYHHPFLMCSTTTLVFVVISFSHHHSSLVCSIATSHLKNTLSMTLKQMY
jgi:hypothetical protein